MPDQNLLSEGFKMTELGPLPEEWEVVPLKEVGVEFFGGGTPSTKKSEYWGGNIPWTTSAYFDGLYLTKGAKSITSKGLENSSSNLVPKGNLLIGTRVGVGKVAINLIDVAISQDLTAMIINKTKVFPEFLAYTLMTKRTQYFFSSGARGVTIKGIPRDDLIQIPIALPPLPEQRAIAHVLSTLQRAVEEQDKIIAAARELKKSLMRHLFTYGPVPPEQAERVLLKETEIGMVPEQWEVVAVEDVVDSTQYGISLRGSPHGKFPILRMNNLADGRVDNSDLQYVDLEEDDFQKFKVCRGDILFNRTNSYELVGKTVVFDLEGDYVFASYLVKVVADTDKLSPRYLNYYLNWEVVQSRMKMFATRGVSQSNINATKLRGFQIRLPPLPEQHEIARILSAVDKKIETEEKRKAALQALFKTMLHLLMTGQIRVKDWEL
jgi:type I restriction enzyme S subunit